MDNYDYDEYYGTSLDEDRQAFWEDFWHVFFQLVGIATCQWFGWRAATLAAISVFIARDLLRIWKRRKDK